MAFIVATMLTAPRISVGSTGDAVVLSPGGGELLQAGSRFEIRWRAPSEAEELELFLILADSPAEQIRLTDQLDPRSGSFDWTVPNLPAQSARLMIRWGRDGVERTGPVGGRFAIDAPDASAALGLRWIGGEWWLTSGFLSAEVLPTTAPLILVPPRGRRNAEVAWSSSESWIARPGAAVGAATGGHSVRPQHAPCRWPAARLPCRDCMRC